VHEFLERLDGPGDRRDLQGPDECAGILAAHRGDETEAGLELPLIESHGMRELAILADERVVGVDLELNPGRWRERLGQPELIGVRCRQVRPAARIGRSARPYRVKFLPAQFQIFREPDLGRGVGRRST